MELGGGGALIQYKKLHVFVWDGCPHTSIYSFCFFFGGGEGCKLFVTLIVAFVAVPSILLFEMFVHLCFPKSTFVCVSKCLPVRFFL